MLQRNLSVLFSDAGICMYAFLKLIINFVFILLSYKLQIYNIHMHLLCHTHRYVHKIFGREWWVTISHSSCCTQGSSTMIYDMWRVHTCDSDKWYLIYRSVALVSYLNSSFRSMFWSLIYILNFHSSIFVSFR